MRRFAFLLPVIVVLIIFVLIIAFGGGDSTPTTDVTKISADAATLEEPRRGSITLKGQAVNVEIVETDDSREQGLSERESLAENEGMWFIFPESRVYPFWMKGMLFDIDIIWVNEEGVIVYIEDNASPDSFPDSFNPGVEAKYVLEVNDEFSEAHEVVVGDKVEF